MKNALYCLLLCSFAFGIGNAQSNDKTILFGASVNYYPVFDTYSQTTGGTTTIHDLFLFFQTPTTGIFELDDERGVDYEIDYNYELHSPMIGPGMSMQWVNKEEVFHELALTRLSFGKSSYRRDFIYVDTTSNRIPVTTGFEQSSFILALRYEYGKYFGDPRRSGLRFGISGGIEPTFYSYNFTPLSSAQFPAQARIMTLELSITPMVEARLSKRAFLDIKLMPNILLADFGSVKVENPILTQEQRQLQRTYDPPEINLAASVVLRYVIKERKRGKR